VKAFIFDCETTGLVKNSLVPLEQQPRIIEFFGHLVDDVTGDILKEIEFFCDPGIPLDPIITRITGITPAQLIGQKKFAHYAPEVAWLIAQSDAAVAHNLSFDMAVLNADCERCGEQPIWPDRLICTVEQSEWIKGHRLKLNDLHIELIGGPFTGAHRARTDVEALTRCYLELRRRGDA
jgi:DNA polymerase III epsilon subunit-like protein